MALTPENIEQHRFTLVRRGYDPVEVDEFLIEVRTAWLAAVAVASGREGAPVRAPTGEPAAEVAPAVEAESPAEAASVDDFGRLGDEVAAVLRQAHESVATLRHRAGAEAALLRTSAEVDAACLRQDAEADRAAATRILEDARLQADIRLAAVRQEADRVAADAAEVARQRADEVVTAAKGQAQAAVTVQRNVRGRLEGTRGDIDTALSRLAEEDEDLFEGIDLITPLRAEEDRVLTPGGGPPSPAVLPPRTTPVGVPDLPYAEDTPEEEAAAEAEDGEDDLAIDLRDDTASVADAPEAPAADEPPVDPLAQMVKRAVENALKRRQDETDQGDPPPA